MYCSSESVRKGLRGIERERESRHTLEFIHYKLQSCSYKETPCMLWCILLSREWNEITLFGNIWIVCLKWTGKNKAHKKLCDAFSWQMNGKKLQAVKKPVFHFSAVFQATFDAFIRKWVWKHKRLRSENLMAYIAQWNQLIVKIRYLYWNVQRQCAKGFVIQ